MFYLHMREGLSVFADPRSAGKFAIPRKSGFDYLEKFPLIARRDESFVFICRILA